LRRFGLLDRQLSAELVQRETWTDVLTMQPGLTHPTALRTTEPVSSQVGANGPRAWMAHRRSVNSTLSIMSKLAWPPDLGLCSHRHRKNNSVRSEQAHIWVRTQGFAMQQVTDTLDPTSSRNLSRSSCLSFTIDRRDHEARLAVVGPLDLATQESMSQAAAAVLHPPVRAVLLDLDGVSFFGAAGVTTLVNINRAAANAGIRLVLTGISPTIRRVLELTGTTDLIPIAYTRTVARTTADSLNHRSGEAELVPTNTVTNYPGPAPGSRLSSTMDSPAVDP